MKTVLTLPENYHESFHIDLQKDKKLALLVNLLALVIAAAVLFAGFFIRPFELASEDFPAMCLAILAASAAYFVLHEAVHGIFMRAFSGVRPHYGFTGLYAYAGSSAYFGRSHYLIIALAPVVIWGLVLAVLCAVSVSSFWFWVWYLIQTTNLSGAAGDLYVTVRFSRLPKTILVQDTGVSMTVYEAG